jgi:myo-inositol-1(or 4)-monophosphatase
VNLQAVRGTAAGIARMAGAELLRYYGQSHEEITKSNDYDIVTEGDRASEAVIVPALMKAFPDHAIISEEGGGTSNEQAEYLWYIDPIDGTTNFAKDIPHFSVSIALADRSGTPLVGIVLNPVTNELFSAARGYGAALNGQTIHVSSIDTLGKAVLATGFPYDRATNPENNVGRWNAFLPHVRDLRRFGSAALDLCYVACGRFDGYWESWLNPWDCMAGILCVLEAGGKITDYKGSTASITGREMIASNGHLHEIMLQMIMKNA